MSPDIPGMKGYTIQTPNMYDGLSACDFSNQGGGYCEYTAFMKDESGHYWVLYGENGGTFSYATNDPAWMKMLPLAFQNELARMKISTASVTMTPASH
jgi:hypothetical protein